MALPPLTPSRSDSPDRVGSPPPAGPAGTRVSNLGPLAPLRGSIPSDMPSPGTALLAATNRTGVSAISGAVAPRSISGAAPAAGPVSPTSSQSPSRRGSLVSPRVVSGPRKLTKAQLAERLHGQLMEVLRTEWKRIKSSNLGVLSGTAVVEELLLRRIQSWTAELHMLAIATTTASERLGALCRAMDATELQQLLVMFDQTGHPELSDFVRVMVFNTGDPSAKTVVGDLRALRAANTANRRARSTPSNRRRPVTVPPPPPRFYQPVAEDPAVLRFAGLLPDGHRLVSGAHAAVDRRRREEEEERRAASAREARARDKEAAGAAGAPSSPQRAERRASSNGIRWEASDASIRQAVLLGRIAPPEIMPYYIADVEEQWRRTVGTRLPTEGVFDSCIMLLEPLPMYEAPPQAALMRVEAEEAATAALAPPTRHGLGMGSVSSRLPPPLSGMAGRAGGNMNWNGPVSASSAATAFKRLTSARPGSVGGPQPPGADSGGAAAEGPGSGPGSGQVSSRLPGASRRGNRSVSMAPEGGLEGMQSGEAAGAGEGARSQRAGSGPGGPQPGSRAPPSTPALP